MTVGGRLPKGVRSALRLIGWNAAWSITGLALIAAAGESWFRLTVPFAANAHPSQFVPGVGLIRKPFAEMRHTNNFDAWNVSRTNSLGFLDREPIDPERAAESCHITMIGDSFVEAREVPVPEKFHVQLEALAARERPELDVTTSAFGIAATTQINQLPYYEEFARHLHPELVVLVFVSNDFGANAPQWRRPFVTVKRNEDGTLALRPPNPDFRRTGTADRLMDMLKRSYFAQWLDSVLDRAEVRTEHPRHTAPPEGRQEFTAFALDRFKEYTSRDGASLAILTSHTVRRHGDRMFNRLEAMARERGIPVIDQYDYVIRKGGRIEDAHWAYDQHWNPTGHRWAAEALFEYLKQHPETCSGAAAGGSHPRPPARSHAEW